MARPRARRDSDRQFYVFMAEKGTTRRVSVGNFWAKSSGEAIAIAQKAYPGFFRNIETHAWIVDAKENFGNAEHRPVEYD